ncbi:hypothetical protein ABEB36_005124 [Hypothenemus hampei]|uniref:CHK kinase-like domain-containing protein n=1 Tax=Hypothenemus hampei TaxID=57062 RepID=A0ABD1EZL1_HYPHA
MTTIPEIKNLEVLLKNNLQHDEVVVEYESSRLTAPGENYGSIMLRVTAKIKNITTGNERNLEIVAKLIPGNKKIEEIFDTQVTYKTEFNFYATVIPTLNTFLKSRGVNKDIDVVARFYGGRINLDGSDRVDEDAVIVLENLKANGYVTGKKNIGLDVPSAKIVLDSLAKFHSVGIGLRLLQPEIFDKNIRPHFYNFVSSYIKDMVYAGLIQVLEGSDEFNTDHIERAKIAYTHDPKKVDVSDIWGTLTNCDAWTNNLLIKYEDGKPVHCVLVDFQVLNYGTPHIDVIFFLLSSLLYEKLEENIDHLLDYYYEQLLLNLKELKMDINIFSRDSFDEETKIAVKNYEYFHTMWMLVPIMNENLKSVDQIAASKNLLNWEKEHVDRAITITKICIQRGWI